MSHNVSNYSVADLQPLATKFLEDRQWHYLSDVLRDIGDQIMPERAVRFCEWAIGKEARPLDEKVRAGRRRCVYLLLNSMIKRGMVECKDATVEPNNREYRLIRTVAELPKRKPPSRRPVSLPTGTSLKSLVDDLQRLFPGKFPRSKDNGDFQFHCRSLRRIILVNESSRDESETATALALPEEVKE